MAAGTTGWCLTAGGRRRGSVRGGASGFQCTASRQDQNELAGGPLPSHYLVSWSAAISSTERGVETLKDIPEFVCVGNYDIKCTNSAKGPEKKRGGIVTTGPDKYDVRDPRSRLDQHPAERGQPLEERSNRLGGKENAERFGNHQIICGGKMIL